MLRIRQKRLIVPIALGLAAALAAVYWFALRRHEDAALRVGYAIEAPYAFIDDQGRLTGEAPELAQAAAQRLGIRLHWVLLPFNDLLPALINRHIDMIAAGMFITPQRQQQVLFSHATLRVRSALLVRAGNPLNICAMQDLLKSGKAAVISGAVEGARLQAIGVAEDRILAVPDLNTGLYAVHSGLADALALSLPSLRWAVNHAGLPGIEVAACAGGGEQAADHTALAFRREDGERRKSWNAALDAYIGSDEHLAMLARLGFMPSDLEDMVAPITAARRRP